MTKRFTAFGYLMTLLCFYLSCSGKRIVAGCYASNFAEGGFFVEHIHLNPDSSFNYRFAGDLANDVHTGKYHLNKDTVILNFDKEFFHNSLIDTQSLSFVQKKPEKLLYRNHKLFNIDSANKVIKYFTVFKAYKKHDPLGPGGHYHNKRHYLKQHPCEV